MFDICILVRGPSDLYLSSLLDQLWLAPGWSHPAPLTTHWTITNKSQTINTTTARPVSQPEKLHCDGDWSDDKTDVSCGQLKVDQSTWVWREKWDIVKLADILPSEGQPCSMFLIIIVRGAWAGQEDSTQCYSYDLCWVTVDTPNTPLQCHLHSRPPHGRLKRQFITPRGNPLRAGWRDDWWEKWVQWCPVYQLSQEFSMSPPDPDISLAPIRKLWSLSLFWVLSTLSLLWSVNTCQHLAPSKVKTNATGEGPGSSIHICEDHSLHMSWLMSWEGRK